MPKINLTPELLKKYFHGQKKYEFYKEATEEAEALNIHANKVYPKKLIEGRRPSESEEIHTYRKEIYKSPTKGPMQKVIGELMKIRKSDDWSVLFKVDTMAGIKKGEEPKTYWEKKFPKFRSLTNWAFSVLLRSMLLEPNSVILVMPMNTKPAKSEYRKPFPYWFPTDCVIEMKEEELCILKSRDKCEYTENGNKYEGEIYYVVDDETIIRYEQTTSTKEFTAKDTYPHGLGYMPAFKVGGQLLKSQEGYYLFESRLAAMIDPLDEASREYSDLQAEVVQHVHSQKWVLDTQSCQKCAGTGKVKQGQPIEIVVCDQCKGSGSVATSPYLNIVIKRAKVGEQQWTGDPAGYIKKPVEIVEIQDKRIDKHIYKALSSVNMEFLAEVPLNESGKAKEVDRDALNTFVNLVAEDLVHNMDRVELMGNDYRYMDIITDTETRETLKSDINVPTRYDILSTNYLVEEVKMLREGKVNPLIIQASEVELANKKFANNPTVRDRLICIFELDPVPGVDDDTKLIRLQNKGITIDDYVISSNIQTLVQMAFFKDAKFNEKKLDEKQKIIAELAKDKIAEAKVKIEVDLNQEVDEDGNPIDPKADPKTDPKKKEPPVKKPEPEPAK